MFIATHFWALFNRRVRGALAERYRIFKKLDAFLQDSNVQNQVRIIVHTASMGEFEHIKPLIAKLASFKNVSVLVTFFSPSGYEYVRHHEGVDLITYLPFDFKFVWRRFYNRIKPALVIISKHDAWPNQVWTANRLSIPVYMVNASLHEGSSRTNRMVRALFNELYKSIHTIFTISQSDEEAFKLSFPMVGTKLMGDTKFDQVLIRKEKTKDQHTINRTWLDQSMVILLGSIWHEDGQQIFPALMRILSEKESLKIIVVPHQPEQNFVNEIMDVFGRYEPCTIDRIERKPESRVLVIDRVGILADLYKYADVAYVGGSFKQGIHNVMEPAVYNIPVLFGPVHSNSFEAIRLLDAGGARLVTNSETTYSTVLDLLENEAKRKKVGENAGHFAFKNTGATERILTVLRENHKGLFI